MMTTRRFESILARCGYLTPASTTGVFGRLGHGKKYLPNVYEEFKLILEEADKKYEHG